jgi:hypothetical protein
MTENWIEEELLEASERSFDPPDPDAEDNDPSDSTRTDVQPGGVVDPFGHHEAISDDDQPEARTE